MQMNFRRNAFNVEVCDTRTSAEMIRMHRARSIVSTRYADIALGAPMNHIPIHCIPYTGTCRCKCISDRWRNLAWPPTLWTCRRFLKKQNCGDNSTIDLKILRDEFHNYRSLILMHNTKKRPECRAIVLGASALAKMSHCADIIQMK